MARLHLPNRQPKGGADDGRAAIAAVNRLGAPNRRSALGSNSPL